MAKKTVTPSNEIDWILRDRKVIDGLDHLGIELVSVNLYQAMLPGVALHLNPGQPVIDSKIVSCF